MEIYFDMESINYIMNLFKLVSCSKVSFEDLFRIGFFGTWGAVTQPGGLNGVKIHPRFLRKLAQIEKLFKIDGEK